MARYVLDITSRSGRRLPGCTGSSNSIAVYDVGDLKERLAAAAGDPDLRIQVRDLDEEG